MSEDAALGGGAGKGWRIAGWSIAGLVLLLPALTNAPWTAFDFVFAGVLIGFVGLAFELTVRSSRDRGFQAGVAVALAAGALTIVAAGAVGMIGSEDNELNLLFPGVVAIALLGAILVRFQAAGMARAMSAAAVAQLLASGIGLSTDVKGGMISASFAGLWLLAALLFRRAAREASHRQRTSA